MAYTFNQLIKAFEDQLSLNEKETYETSPAVIVGFLVNNGLNMARTHMNNSIELLKQLSVGIQKDSFETFGHYRTAVQIFLNSITYVETDFINLSILIEVLPQKGKSGMLLTVSKKIFDYVDDVYKTRSVWEDALPVYTDLYKYLVEKKDMLNADFLI